MGPASGHEKPCSGRDADIFVGGMTGKLLAGAFRLLDNGLEWSRAS
jgi:hypothetical protein